MKSKFWLFVMYAFGAVACTNVVGAPEPGESMTMTVESGVSNEGAERVFNAWRERSSGLVDVHTGPDGDARVVAGEKNSFSRPSRVIRLAPSSPERTEAALSQMVGRMLGIELHDGPGVMGRTVGQEWTEADAESCRAAGWCR